MRKTIAGLALLFVLAAVSAFGPEGLRTIDTGATVPGKEVPIWVNSYGIVTRWADSTEFPGAGPNGCRVPIQPVHVSAGYVVAGSHQWLYSDAGGTLCDSVGVADSTLSNGFYLPRTSYLRNFRYASKTTLTGASAPACTMVVRTTAFGAGQTIKSKFLWTYSTGDAAYDTGTGSFAWPDTVWKFPAGTVVTFETGFAASNGPPRWYFDIFPADSVP